MNFSAASDLSDRTDVTESDFPIPHLTEYDRSPFRSMILELDNSPTFHQLSAEEQSRLVATAYAIDGWLRTSYQDILLISTFKARAHAGADAVYSRDPDALGTPQGLSAYVRSMHQSGPWFSVDREGRLFFARGDKFHLAQDAPPLQPVDLSAIVAKHPRMRSALEQYQTMCRKDAGLAGPAAPPPPRSPPSAAPAESAAAADPPEDDRQSRRCDSPLVDQGSGDLGRLLSGVHDHLHSLSLSPSRSAFVPTRKAPTHDVPKRNVPARPVSVAAKLPSAGAASREMRDDCVFSIVNVESSRAARRIADPVVNEQQTSSPLTELWSRRPASAYHASRRAVDIGDLRPSLQPPASPADLAEASEAFQFLNTLKPASQSLQIRNAVSPASTNGRSAHGGRSPLTVAFELPDYSAADTAGHSLAPPPATGDAVGADAELQTSPLVKEEKKHAPAPIPVVRDALQSDAFPGDMWYSDVVPTTSDVYGPMSATVVLDGVPTTLLRRDPPAFRQNLVPPPRFSSEDSSDALGAAWKPQPHQPLAGFHVPGLDSVESMFNVPYVTASDATAPDEGSRLYGGHPQAAPQASGQLQVGEKGKPVA